MYSVNIEYICQFLHDIKMLKGAIAVKACSVLIVKLNKCTLSILVSNDLFLDRQRNMCTSI